MTKKKKDNYGKYCLKRCLLFFIVVILLLFNIPDKANASNVQIWDGTAANSFAGGTGSESDPYLIANGEQLAYFAENVNNGTDYSGKYISLANDIYLNDISTFEQWSVERKPANVWPGISDFNGIFDGNDHTIYGLYMNRTEDCTGFFITTKYVKNKDVIIQNLHFVCSNVRGTSYVGTIIGDAETACVSNCSVIGKIFGSEGSSYVGGLVGHFSSGGNRKFDMINCTNYASVAGANSVGGLIGYASIGNSSGSSNSGNGNEYLKIRYCTNKGQITGTDNQIGGLFGRLGRSMNCGGIVTDNLHNKGNVSGAKYIGGIAGYCDIDYKSALFEKFSNTGSVQGTEFAGGIFGYGDCEIDETILQDSYNAGKISGTKYVGGLSGYNTTETFRCHNVGKIEGTEYVASLDNCNANGVTVRDCYWLEGTASSGHVKKNDTIIKLTAEEFKVRNHFPKLDFGTIWIMGGQYPELRLQPDGMNIPSLMNSNCEIIRRVSEYITEDLYAQYDSIAKSNYSYETKHKQLLNLFATYGITDVQEGIRYLSNTTDKRAAYLALTTDELYCASNFEYKLNNGVKGAAMRLVLDASGLVFNNEINSWLDFSNLASNEYPGVQKYKEMLYDFMDAASVSIEIQSNIKLLSDLAENANSLDKERVDEIISKLNQCKTIAEEKEILSFCEENGIWTTLAEAQDSNGNLLRDENGSVLLTYQLDKSSGFGQFAKAMDISTKVISITNMTIESIRDWVQLDSKLQIYCQYEHFLKEVHSNLDLPFELRWAAYLILEEIEVGYLGEIEDIVLEIFEVAEINELMQEQLFKKLGISSIRTWLTVLNIEAFFINQIADVGEMIKKEAYVEGYAYLANEYKDKLDEAKKEFILDSSEDNGWNFHYNYNLLYQLRYKGEEAYLAMTKVEGLASKLYDFGYENKEKVVNKTLNMLEEKCLFTFEEAEALPESCQFTAKSVVKCPVDVVVYSPDGEVITTLKDGEISDVTNEYGRFTVVYDVYSNDYVKVLCFHDENCTYTIIGKDEGLVSMESLQNDEGAKKQSFDNIAISAKDVIKKETTEDGESYSIDFEGDGTIDIIEIFTTEEEVHNPVESMEIDTNSITLDEGASKLLHVEVSPSTATVQTVKWTSDDPEIATVVNGKVTAISAGTTTIRCISVDNPDLIYNCKVEVNKKEKPEIELKFAGASLELKDDISIRYMVNSSLFAEGAYTDPYILVELNGNETKITDYTVDGDYYVFRFDNIAPHQMNDKAYATIYATYDDKEYASVTRDYSVATYCYSMLEKCKADTYAEFRTLLVDLLHYGAKTQLFVNYNTDNLVDANLTEAQRAWGTQINRELVSVLDPKYETVDNPTANWRGAGLNLQESIKMRFVLAADSIDGLSVKVTCDGKEWIIPVEKFTLTSDGYEVLFDGLNAAQLSEEVYVTVYKDGAAVSNTARYSVESYAWAKQSDANTKLADLVKAMMKYGDAVYNYVN